MSNGPAIDVSEGEAGHLAALATSYRDARETEEKHRDRLHLAIVDAIDNGMRPADVARAVGVSTPRIYGIIERVYRKAGTD